MEHPQNIALRRCLFRRSKRDYRETIVLNNLILEIEPPYIPRPSTVVKTMSILQVRVQGQ